MDKLKTLINQSKVLVLSRTKCHFCCETKKLLDSAGAKATTIELDNHTNGRALQAAALRLTQQRTVPCVFINGRFVGGNQQLEELSSSGELKNLLSSRDDSSKEKQQ